MNNSSSKFNLVVSSDLEYEKLVVYLMYEKEIVAILNNDANNDHPIIEIEDRFEEKTIWDFPLKDFLETLQSAQNKLLEINKNNP